MKLLYFFTEFLDQSGGRKAFRGLDQISLNLSALERFSYDCNANTLRCMRRSTPLPERFWDNEATKTVETQPLIPSLITNVNVIAGENGSGKSTVIQYLIDYLDAVYGALSSRSDTPSLRYDPRPHRSLLLLEGEEYAESNEGNSRQRIAQKQAWYLLDYSPSSARRESVILEGKWPEHGTMLCKFTFHDWKKMSVPKYINGSNKAEREQLIIRGIAQALLHTKIIYMNNTLSRRDYERHVRPEDNERLRDAFVYDCSLGAAIGPDVAQFFPYEVYKQVKYVFDKNQYELRKKLKDFIPELRIPQSLTIYPRMEDYHNPLNERISSSFQQLQSAPSSGEDIDGSGFVNLLSTLCLGAYANNIGAYQNLRSTEMRWQNRVSGETGKQPSNTNPVCPILEAVCDIASSTIISGSDDGTLREINAVGQELQILRGHRGAVLCFAVFPDGRVVSGSEDRTLRVWDSNTDRCLLTLEGHKSYITCLAVLNNTIVVSGSYDHTLRVWNVSTGACISILKGHEDSISCVTALSEERVISGSADGTLRIWDIRTGECLHSLDGQNGYICCMKVLPDGRRVVSGSKDGTLRVWNADTYECLRVLKCPKEPISCVAVLPEERVISGSGDNTLYIWNVRDGLCLNELEGHQEITRCIAVFSDGRRVVSGSFDRTLRVWDADTGRCLHTLEGHTGAITCVTVLPDGCRVVSGSADGTLRIWDADTGQYLQTVKPGGKGINDVAVLPNRFGYPFATQLKESCQDYLDFIWKQRKTLFSHFRQLPDKTGYVLDMERVVKNEKVYTLLSDFLQKYRKTCAPAYTLDFDWGLSSGEENMLRLFSNLYHVFDRDNRADASGESYQIYNNERHLPPQELTEACDTVLLFLDEADLTLHPEWQRRLIHLLTAFLPRIYPGPTTKELQLILTTHSPLLLGDVPCENVTYLARGKQVEDGESSKESIAPLETFGQNIHTILKTSFFLKDGTVGEFAAKKINAAAARLQELAETGEDCPPDEMDALRRTVALIAPGILRAELERLLRDANRSLRSREAQLERLISEATQLSKEDQWRLFDALKQEGDFYD